MVSIFMDQETFEALTLSKETLGTSLRRDSSPRCRCTTAPSHPIQAHILGTSLQTITNNSRPVGLCFFHANHRQGFRTGPDWRPGQSPCRRRKRGTPANPGQRDRSAGYRGSADRRCLQRQGSSKNRCWPGASFEPAAPRHRGHGLGAPSRPDREASGKSSGRL